MIKKLLLPLSVLAMATTTGRAALVAYWDLNTVNESESSTVGTLTGDATVGNAPIAPGGSGSLATTNGKFESNMEASDIPGFGGTGSFTILSWIKTEGTGTQTVFGYSPSNGASGGADLRFYLSGGKFRIEMSGGSGFTLGGSFVDNLNDNAVHMMGVRFDSSTGDSFHDIDLYVDGNIYDVTGGTDNTVNIGQTVNMPSGKIRFADDIFSDRQFAGTIDDVAIYDEALTSSQLADIRANGVIPEPSSAILLGLGGLVMVLRRRR